LTGLGFIFEFFNFHSFHFQLFRLPARSYYKFVIWQPAGLIPELTRKSELAFDAQSFI